MKHWLITTLHLWQLRRSGEDQPYRLRRLARHFGRLTPLALTTVLFTGCTGTNIPSGSGSSVESVAPVHSPEPHGRTRSLSTPTPPAPPTTVTPKDPTSGVVGDHVTSSPGGSDLISGPTEAVIIDLLARYDRVAADLAIDPTTSSDPTSPQRIAWSTVVAPDSILHPAILDLLVNEPAQEGTRIVPSDDGIIYRHHLIRSTATDDGAIDFTWCGFSPGVRVDSATLDVVDGQVTKTVGVGRAISWPTPLGSVWMLDDLASMDSSALPEGSTDPCI